MISTFVLLTVLRSDFIIVTPIVIPAPIAEECKHDPKPKKCKQ